MPAETRVLPEPDDSGADGLRRKGGPVEKATDYSPLQIGVLLKMAKGTTQRRDLAARTLDSWLSQNFHQGLSYVTPTDADHHHTVIRVTTEHSDIPRLRGAVVNLVHTMDELGEKPILEVITTSDSYVCSPMGWKEDDENIWRVSTTTTGDRRRVAAQVRTKDLLGTCLANSSKTQVSTTSISRAYLGGLGSL